MGRIAERMKISKDRYREREREKKKYRIFVKTIYSIHIQNTYETDHYTHTLKYLLITRANGKQINKAQG